MTITTRTAFTKQLGDIEGYLVRLKEKTTADIRATGLGLQGDEGALEGVANGRKAEERLRSAIEESCLDAMLLQQPLIGDDLRFVTGTFRIVGDITRSDDMTRDIAYLADEIPEKARKKFEAEFAEMSECAADMTDRSITAFCSKDLEGARQVIEADTRINSLYDECENKLVALIRDGKSSGEYLPELLMVAKYYERMGDNAKRIAAWAEFRVTGTHRVEGKVDQLGGLEG